MSFTSTSGTPRHTVPVNQRGAFVKGAYSLEALWGFDAKLDSFLRAVDSFLVSLKLPVSYSVSARPGNPIIEKDIYNPRESTLIVQLWPNGVVASPEEQELTKVIQKVVLDCFTSDGEESFSAFASGKFASPSELFLCVILGDRGDAVVTHPFLSRGFGVWDVKPVLQRFEASMSYT